MYTVSLSSYKLFTYLSGILNNLLNKLYELRNHD